MKVRPLAAIKEIVVHCAATPNGNGSFTIEDIDEWHRTAPTDYGGCGYHWVIHVDGKAVQGRKPEQVGAHCKGHNHQSIGVCLIGTDAFTLDQWRALRDLVIRATDGLGRQLLVYGHREFADKACPGFDVTEWLVGGMAPLTAHIFTPGEKAP